LVAINTLRKIVLGVFIMMIQQMPLLTTKTKVQKPEKQQALKTFTRADPRPNKTERNHT
jgi:hypothetical protein